MENNSPQDIAARIEKLASLCERGLLTDEEFSAAKRIALGISNSTSQGPNQDLSLNEIHRSNENRHQAGTEESHPHNARLISDKYVHNNLAVRQEESIRPHENKQNRNLLFNTDVINNHISIINDGYAFQSKLVMDQICQRELAKIKEEQAMWRIGGAIVGGLIGLGDGFDISDIFLGAAVSQVGAVAYGQASKEQIEFLEKIKADWLVTANSPIDLARRYGPASSRILILNEGDFENHWILNHHRGGAREECFVPLGFSSQFAKGFLQADTNDVLKSNFDEENYEIIANQLYPVPDILLRLDSFRKISDDEAVDHYGQAARLIINRGGKPYKAEMPEVETDIVFKFPIPHHSDF